MNLLSDKTARLKAETIVSSFRQEFALLHLIKHKLPTEASFNNLTEAYVRVENFASTPEPSADSQQRCTQFASQITSSSANVPPPASANPSTPSHLWNTVNSWLGLNGLFTFYLVSYFSSFKWASCSTSAFYFLPDCCLIFCFQNGRVPNCPWWEAFTPHHKFCYFDKDL